MAQSTKGMNEEENITEIMKVKKVDVKPDQSLWWFGWFGWFGASLLRTSAPLISSCLINSVQTNIINSLYCCVDTTSHHMSQKDNKIHDSFGGRPQSIFQNNRKFDKYALYHLIIQRYLNSYCYSYIPNDIYNIIYKYYCQPYVIKDFNLIKPNNTNRPHSEELALRNSFSMVSNGKNKVYIFGGKYVWYDDDNSTYLKSLWEITIVNGENRLSVNWKEIKTEMTITPQTHTSLMHHNNKLYLIGGVPKNTFETLNCKVNELYCLDLNNKVNDEYAWSNIVIGPLSILNGINCAYVYKEHILVLGFSKSEYVLFRISLNTHDTNKININYAINSKFKDVGYDTTLMDEKLIIFASNNLYYINLDTYKCEKIIDNLLYQIECPLLLSFDKSIIIVGGGQREKMFSCSDDPPISTEIILFDNIMDIGNVIEYKVDYKIQLLDYKLYYRMEGCVVNNLIVLFGGHGCSNNYMLNNIYITKINDLI